MRIHNKIAKNTYVSTDVTTYIAYKAVTAGLSYGKKRWTKKAVEWLDKCAQIRHLCDERQGKKMDKLCKDIIKALEKDSLIEINQAVERLQNRIHFIAPKGQTIIKRKNKALDLLMAVSLITGLGIGIPMLLTVSADGTTLDKLSTIETAN